MNRITLIGLCALALTSLQSCDAVSALKDCLCAPRTGNEKIDAFFDSAEAVELAAAQVEARLDGATTDLALSLGLASTATPEEIHTGLCSAFTNAGSAFQVTYAPPECRTEVNIAAQAAAECDVNIDPGQIDIECNAHCDGTCRASCTGSCRLPSVEAYCEGTCHGTCEVDSSAVCYGTCHGQCAGTCSVLAGGACAGSCDGVCTGRCEATVSAACTGECRGECEITVTGGNCNARCEGTCQGRCEGSCEGGVVAPSADVDCEAQIQARAEASIDCVPPTLSFTQNEQAVQNISAVTHHLGRVLAASAEVSGVLLSVTNFTTPLSSSARSLINGELDAGQTACALGELNDVAASLAAAGQALQSAVGTDVAIVAPCI